LCGRDVLTIHPTTTTSLLFSSPLLQEHHTNRYTAPSFFLQIHVLLSSLTKPVAPQAKSHNVRKRTLCRLNSASVGRKTGFGADGEGSGRLMSWFVRRGALVGGLGRRVDEVRLDVKGVEDEDRECGDELSLSFSQLQVYISLNKKVHSLCSKSSS
jgi:hypothetical protein